MAQNINGNCRVNSYILNCVILGGSWNLPLCCSAHTLYESSLVQRELHKRGLQAAVQIGRPLLGIRRWRLKQPARLWIVLPYFWQWLISFTSPSLKKAQTMKYLATFIICLKITHTADSLSYFVFHLLMAQNRCHEAHIGTLPSI